VPYVIGVVLSVAAAAHARHAGFDRHREFYPTVLVVIALFYVLFAAISQSMHAVVVESVVMTAFAVAAIAGFRSSPWIIVAALVGHGIFDVVHGGIVENAGVPAWWPAFCLAYDFGAAACLAWILLGRRVAAHG
jgi:hypothetical protein